MTKEEPEGGHIGTTKYPIPQNILTIEEFLPNQACLIIHNDARNPWDNGKVQIDNISYVASPKGVMELKRYIGKIIIVCIEGSNPISFMVIAGMSFRVYKVVR